MYWSQKLLYWGKFLFILLLTVIVVIFILNIDKISGSFSTTLSQISSDVVKGKTLFDVIIFITSIVAFVLSIVNFLDSAKPAKIKIFPGNRAVLLVNAHVHGFHIPMTFININNSPGIISKCSLEVASVKNDKDRYLMEWSSFCKDEGQQWENESQVYSVPIEGKSSIKKVVTFSENANNAKKITFQKGEYKILISTWIAGKKDIYSTIECRFSIDDNTAAFIESRKQLYPKPCKSGHVFISIYEK